MKYRKKPIEVDAIRWTGDNLASIGVFVGPTDPPLMDEEDWSIIWIWVEKSKTRCAILTGGWVIAEPDGVGFYPCTEEQFDATYSPVTEADDSNGWSVLRPNLLEAATHHLYESGIASLDNPQGRMSRVRVLFNTWAHTVFDVRSDAMTDAWKDRYGVNSEPALRSLACAIAWDHPGTDEDCPQCAALADAARALGVTVESLRP